MNSIPSVILDKLMKKLRQRAERNKRKTITIKWKKGRRK